MIAPQPSLWDDASCRDLGDAPATLFFSDRIPDILRAKAICDDCTLAGPCLAGAIERGEPWGVWGGQLIADGVVLTHKRPRGRPPKGRPAEGIALTA